MRLCHAVFNIQNRPAHRLKNLLACLRDSDSKIRGSAALAAGALGQADVVEDLHVLLRDKDGFVREFAAQAIGDIGVYSPNSISLLEAAARRKVIEREVADEAIKRLKERRRK